jgi:UV DNA damage endonuclease
VSLTYLRETFTYLEEQGIQMYRMASGLAPYATHPDHPEFHSQVAECTDELAELGEAAHGMGLRLSFHPGQFIVLNAREQDLADRSAADVEVQASLLENMGLDDEAVVVLHIGGVYGDRTAALERFARRFEQLSPVAQRRLILENDDGRFGVGDLLWLHNRIGIRIAFDVHHFHCHNPDGMGLTDAARACLETWRGWATRPKIHFSSPRTDWGFRHGTCEEPGIPKWTAHAEFADPFAFIAFYRRLADIAPDVMLEAKAKDVAVIELRGALVRYAPDLAELFGLTSG